jgi:hypothetical protein
MIVDISTNSVKMRNLIAMCSALVDAVILPEKERRLVNPQFRNVLNG